MIYLESFRLPTAEQEEFFFSDLGFVPTEIYPWRFLSAKDFSDIDCEKITILYGGNGCGKSTALNAIAKKIGIERRTPYNCGYYYYNEFIEMCSYKTNLEMIGNLAQLTTMITSDDVFDSMLTTRKRNMQHELRADVLDDFRLEVIHAPIRGFDCDNPKSIDNYIKSVNARNMSRRRYLHNEIGDKERTYSNGETGYVRIIKQIKDGLYILDEPENSLSAKWQCKLAEFIKLSADSCDCQFIIATHSPFLLAIEDAKIYNLDEDYVTISKWCELESTKLYYDLFSKLNGIIK